MLSAPPVRSTFENPADTSGSGVTYTWLKWFQSITNAFKQLFGAPVSLAPGVGPANPGVVVKWTQIEIGGQTFWVALYL